jgi:hypothetical protein
LTPRCAAAPPPESVRGPSALLQRGERLGNGIETGDFLNRDDCNVAKILSA